MTAKMIYKNYTIDFQTEAVSRKTSYWVYSKSKELMGGFNTINEAKKYIDSIT